MDETYRKAKKMDQDRFSTLLVPDRTDLIKIMRNYLLEGTDSNRKIRIERYKLNVYSMRLSNTHIFQGLTCYTGEGSFFKAHVDTPRSQKMFGSLVIVFPTSHEGGALVFRHRGEEWMFDSSAALSAAGPTSIAYAAFFSDVEHEILPVTSGHRVTLTYNLYFDDASAKDLVSEPPPLPQDENEQMFRSRLDALLKNPEFLPDGGRLGFGMRHEYQVIDRLKHVYSLLKGSDATVYQSLRALGLKPVLYLDYRYCECNDEAEDTVLLDRVPRFEYWHGVESLYEVLDSEGGITIPSNEQVTWVTPETTGNTLKSAYAAHGNEPSVEFVYADLCLIVCIPSVAKRLGRSRS
jgi:hypothetical protein